MKIGRRLVLAKTCTSCHKFKQGIEFAKYKGGLTQSWCKKCISSGYSMATKEKRWLMANTYNKISNDASQEHATHKTEPWTENEIKRLKKLWETDMPRKDVAKAMGRSIKSCRIARDRYILGRPHG